MSFRILIVDAYEAHRKVLVEFIHHVRPDVEVHQYDPSIAGRPHTGFDWAGYTLIIMDSRLGEEDGLQWFQDYSSSIEGFPPMMFLSSQNNVDIAVRAMKLGARDFVPKKNIKPNRLRQALLDILPEEPPPDDLMPDMKPLPGHDDTLDYSGAATQVLPGSVKKAAPQIDDIEDIEDIVKEVEDEDSYWDQQTQILHEPPPG